MGGAGDCRIVAVAGVSAQSYPNRSVKVLVSVPAGGFNLLVATDSMMSINPHLYAKLPYDPERDFAPISQIAQLDRAT